MSIWGPGPFDNDDGADWFADIRDAPSLDALRTALAEVSDPQYVGFIEMVDGAEAFAAAEVLAELLDSPGDEPVLNEDHATMVETLTREIGQESPRDINALVRQAINALDVVLNDSENSELRQLWEEQADVMPEWVATVTALQQRLQRLAAG
jgi:Domain of unknown function (DUF4259)